MDEGEAKVITFSKLRRERTSNKAAEAAADMYRNRNQDCNQTRAPDVEKAIQSKQSRKRKHKRILVIRDDEDPDLRKALCVCIVTPRAFALQ